MPLPALSPRPIFDPSETYRMPGAAPAGPGRSGWRALFAAMLTFYRDPLAWLALGVTSVLLSYLGGMVMFWFHAVELGEGGPAIAWWIHWLLDSTFGFLVLTPALALIIPIGVLWARTVAGPARPRALRWAYMLITGGLFAAITIPGPVAHDLVVGRGTWIAEQVTAAWGDPAAAPSPPAEYPLAAALTQQLGAGVVIYLALAALSVSLVRGIVRARRTSRSTAAGGSAAAKPPVPTSPPDGDRPRRGAAAR